MLLAILCFYNRVAILTFISFIVIELASGYIKELKHDFQLFVLLSILWPISIIEFLGHTIFKPLMKLSLSRDDSWLRKEDQ